LSDSNLMRLKRSIAKVSNANQLAFPNSGWDLCMTQHQGES
jgi:hypothetical protein